MKNVATSTRNITKIKLRKFQFFCFRAIRKFFELTKNTDNTTIDNILVYPEFKQEEGIKYFVNKILWYLPPNKYKCPQIKIGYNKDFAFHNLKNVTYKNQGNFYTEDHEYIEFIPEIGKSALKWADVILLWKLNNSIFRALPYWNKSTIVDENFFSTLESENFSKFLTSIAGNKVKRKLTDISKENFKKLKHNSSEKGYVFCTGPSVEKAYDYNFKNGFSVICNSMVKNKELMAHIHPDVLTFADPVFHFGPSKYATKFRQLMLEAVEEFDLFVVVPESRALLLLSHYPKLKGNIIVSRITHNQKNKFTFPTDEEIKVRGTSNILTLFMLPFASSFSNKIYLLGCDGRKEGEDYFWEHNPEVQFEGLKKTAFKTHPSFFRDRVYTDYYKQHCETLAKFLEFGENRDKMYYSLTKSYIPALKKRYWGKRKK